jgi:hypothetical protein
MLRPTLPVSSSFSFFSPSKPMHCSVCALSPSVEKACSMFLDMSASLLEVVLEARAELVVLHLVDQLGQHLVGQLLLHVEDVPELVQEELAGSCDLGHVLTPLRLLSSGLPGRVVA